MAENISHWPSLQLTPLYGPETYMTSVAINVIVLDISSSKSAGLAKPFFGACRGKRIPKELKKYQSYRCYRISSVLVYKVSNFI